MVLAIEPQRHLGKGPVIRSGGDLRQFVIDGRRAHETGESGVENLPGRSPDHGERRQIGDRTPGIDEQLVGQVHGVGAVRAGVRREQVGDAAPRGGPAERAQAG